MGTSYAPNIVNDGLVFSVDAANPRSYPGSGNNCFNLKNITITGSLKDDTTFNTDGGGTFEFDGTDDHIDFGRPSILNFTPQTNTFSISAWFKTSQFGTIYSFGAPSGNASTQIKITVRGDNYYPEMVLGGTVTAGSTALNDSNWHNIVVTVPAASSGAILYLDGASHVTGNIGTATSSENALIGARTDGSGFEWVDKISNVKIYNKALSAAEVKQNYNALKGRFQ
jgi:hypothetical protein